jgi:hypothetical protein
MISHFPKVCRCCGSAHSESQWDDLPVVGRLDDRDDSLDGALLELRNCTCGTTLSVCLADWSFDGEQWMPVEDGNA